MDETWLSHVTLTQKFKFLISGTVQLVRHIFHNPILRPHYSLAKSGSIEPKVLEKTKKMDQARGTQSTEVAFLPLTQQPWAQFSVFPNIYFDFAKIYRWRKVDRGLKMAIKPI